MNDEETKKALARFSEWQTRADDDEAIAEIAIRANGPPNPVCFHSEQLAEKYLKGYIAFNNQLPQKTHKLDVLLSICKGIDTTFSEIDESAKALNEFYTETRYPADMPEFSLDQCKQALEIAKKIKVFVLARIALTTAS